METYQIFNILKRQNFLKNKLKLKKKMVYCKLANASKTQNISVTYFFFFKTSQNVSKIFYKSFFKFFV